MRSATARKSAKKPKGVKLLLGAEVSLGDIGGLAKRKRGNRATRGLVVETAGTVLNRREALLVAVHTFVWFEYPYEVQGV